MCHTINYKTIISVQHNIIPNNNKISADKTVIYHKIAVAETFNLAKFFHKKLAVQVSLYTSGIRIKQCVSCRIQSLFLKLYKCSDCMDQSCLVAFHYITMLLKWNNNWHPFLQACFLLLLQAIYTVFQLNVVVN